MTESGHGRSRLHLPFPRLRRSLGLDRESIAQNFWWLAGVAPERVGYQHEPGRLTRQRLERHRALRRPIHITLLDCNEAGFGSMNAFWINERSRCCSASVNSRVEDADIVWVFSQDPLTGEARRRISAALDRARPEAKILNHPDRYDVYHSLDCFPRLRAAGVGAPRGEEAFGPEDVGKTLVVYKMQNVQTSPKSQELYDGPRAGYRAFEFVDSRSGPDNWYQRARVYYLAGTVRPGYWLSCGHWNVCGPSKPHREAGFDMTPNEIQQTRRIAETLGLDYFAADYLRRADDGVPFFVDINIYPDIYAVPVMLAGRHYFGIWHTYDTRPLLGVPEPGGRPFAEVFDQAMTHFARGEPYPCAPDAYN
ncbi:MAG: hypothetical protein H7Z41_04855 [Cytophagales bacterium]|nr:hypothetical protein [Armatimonadota bacterium]